MLLVEQSALSCSLQSDMTLHCLCIVYVLVKECKEMQMEILNVWKSLFYKFSSQELIGLATSVIMFSLFRLNSVRIYWSSPEADQLVCWCVSLCKRLVICISFTVRFSLLNLPDLAHKNILVRRSVQEMETWTNCLVWYIYLLLPGFKNVQIFECYSH